MVKEIRNINGKCRSFGDDEIVRDRKKRRKCNMT